MARRTALTRLLLSLLLLLPVGCLAQRYEVRGECNVSGTMTLEVYDGDTVSHTFTAEAGEGGFYFTGNVEGPVLAALRHGTMREPLLFYLEGSDIHINLNATHPGQSVVKGSRSNSEYRSLQAAMQQADPATWLRRYIMEHPAAIYAPHLLYQQTATLDEGQVRRLCNQLQGAAQHTRHYALLQRWLRSHAAEEEEVTRLPEFEYCDSLHTTCSYSTTRDTVGYTLIFVGAGWCDICQRQLAETRRIMDSNAGTLIAINIDDHPAGWDAPYVRNLGIDHLPYLILVDAAGLVVARNITPWELDDYR